MKKNRNIWSLILSIIVLVATIGIFGPLEVYLSNSDDIWFSFSDVIKIILILSGAMVLLLGILGWLLRGKARSWFGACLFLLGVGLFVQGTFLNISLGTLDGKSIDWNKYLTHGIINTAIWLVILAAGIILFIRKEKLFSFIQKIGSGMVLFIEAATIIVLLLTSGNLHQVNNTASYLSTEGIYSVGEDGNIVIFVLDTLDETYFQEALEQSEEYNHVFQDFIHYDNAAVAAATTKAALPAMITGKAYSGGVSYQEYINQAFDYDGLYTQLREKGYDTRIYTESGYVAVGVEDRIQNQTGTGYKARSYLGLALKYEQMILFKYAPHVFKPFAWMYTGDLEEYKSGSDGEAYKHDDVKYYENLMENGIQIIPGKTFRLYHLNGSHPPYSYDKEVKRSDESSVIEQTEGALKIVADYLDILKENDVYDNSTIIVMADHGDQNNQYPQANKAHGVLLVKEMDQRGEIMASSSSPVSYWDLHDEIFSVINPGTGMKYADSTETVRDRLYYEYGTEHGTIRWKEYVIQGDLNNGGKPIETGRVFRPDMQKTDYKYGQVLTFGNDSTAVQYVISGISATDTGTHSWTNDKKVVFEIPLESKPKKNLLITMKLAGVYNEAGPQALLLYANEKLCSKQILTTGGLYQFVVPGSIIEEKKLDLQMLLPFAASPRALFGADNRADSRTLALAFSGLIIEETEKETTEVIIPTLLPNERGYLFTEGENEANNCFTMGLSEAEEKYAWTNNHYAIMEFMLDDITSNDLELTLMFSRVYNSQQHCRIRIGNTILFEKTLSEDDKEISFVFPKRCMINGKEIHFIMELPDACSPSELGTGKDKRELALALTRMIIREKND